jgi:hypothetical protein
MEFIIVAAAAFGLGWYINSRLMSTAFTRLLERLNISQRQLGRAIVDTARELGVDDPHQLIGETEKQRQEVEVKIEQHQGQLFAYRVDNDSFIAQARSGPELVKRFHELYDGRYRIQVSELHGAEFIRDHI